MSQAAPEPLWFTDYGWPPTPITDVDQAAAIMRDRIGEAYDTLEIRRLAFLDAALVDGNAAAGRAAARIAEYQAELRIFMEQIDAHVRAYLQLHIIPRYAEGALAASGGTVMGWTTAHQRALTSLASDTYEDFLRRAREAEAVSEALVRAVRQAAGVEIPKALAGGRTAAQAGAELAARLEAQYGISHVTYANRARVPVRAWAHMAARTKSGVALNAGTLNQYHQMGVNKVEVFDGPGCGWVSHNDGNPANGKIVSVASAAAHLLSHPNCRRAFGATGMDVAGIL